VKFQHLIFFDLHYTRPERNITPRREEKCRGPVKGGGEGEKGGAVECWGAGGPAPRRRSLPHHEKWIWGEKKKSEGKKEEKSLQGAPNPRPPTDKPTHHTAKPNRHRRQTGVVAGAETQSGQKREPKRDWGKKEKKWGKK